MDDKLFNEQWLSAFILSPVTNYNLSRHAFEDEWAMWNSGGEL